MQSFLDSFEFYTCRTSFVRRIYKNLKNIEWQQNLAKVFLCLSNNIISNVLQKTSSGLLIIIW